jgi:hypothetical protein
MPTLTIAEYSSCRRIVDDNNQYFKNKKRTIAEKIERSVKRFRKIVEKHLPPPSSPKINILSLEQSQIVNKDDTISFSDNDSSLLDNDNDSTFSPSNTVSSLDDDSYSLDSDSTFSSDSNSNSNYAHNLSFSLNKKDTVDNEPSTTEDYSFSSS